MATMLQAGAQRETVPVPDGTTHAGSELLSNRETSKKAHANDAVPARSPTRRASQPWSHPLQNPRLSLHLSQNPLSCGEGWEQGNSDSSGHKMTMG